MEWVLWMNQRNVYNIHIYKCNVTAVQSPLSNTITKDNGLSSRRSYIYSNQQVCGSMQLTHTPISPINMSNEISSSLRKSVWTIQLELCKNRRATKASADFQREPQWKGDGLIVCVFKTYLAIFNHTYSCPSTFSITYVLFWVIACQIFSLNIT